jgi:hypothetical protein
MRHISDGSHPDSWHPNYMAWHPDVQAVRKRCGLKSYVARWLSDWLSSKVYRAEQRSLLANADISKIESKPRELDEDEDT